MADENEQDTPEGGDESTDSPRTPESPPEPESPSEPESLPAPEVPRAPEYPVAPPPPQFGSGQFGSGGVLGSMPTPAEAEDRTPAPPAPVVISFWIWIAGAVLSVVGGLLTISNRDAILDQVRKNPPKGVTPDQYQALVNTSVAVSVAIAVAFAGLYVLFAYKIKAGRNWARTTLTVLTVLGVVYDLYVGATPSTYISALVSVIAVALLYMPASRDFFAATRAPRP